MPSAAAAKLEKQASTEALDPIKQAIVVVEHKIRNLEKRKRKIETYREEQKNGKELNSDQLNAVSKFDEVLLTLDFARDLNKQFNGISIDAAKQQKKQARKEALERTQQEIAKVKEILLIQDVLNNIGTEAAREDFLQGRNGATQLTDDDLKFLDDIYLEVFPKRGNEEGLPPFADQVQSSAEHLISIVDGKAKDVVGTTYNKLKELILSIHNCGYFDQNLEEVVEETTEEAAAPVQTTTTDELVEEEETFLVESQTVVPSSEPQTFPQGAGPAVAAAQPGVPPVQQGVIPPAAQAPVVNQTPPPAQQMVQPAPQMVPVPTPVAAVENSFFSTAAATFVPSQPTLPQNRPLNEVIGTGNFNFLQDSELDSPDMSVMMSATPGQTPVQHVPPQSNPVAVPPIPSQTFTNQNFAAVTTTTVQPKVVFQPPGDMAHHIPGFATATPNPPPPIPMPPGHQVPGAAAQRPVAVHQMPPVSQPAPPVAAMPQHRPTLTQAVSYGGTAPAVGGTAPAVPPHTYAAQAQHHAPPPQAQQPQQQQQQPPPQPAQPQLAQASMQHQPQEVPARQPLQMQPHLKYQEPPQEVPARQPLTMLPGRQPAPGAGMPQVQAAAAPVQPHPKYQEPPQEVPAPQPLQMQPHPKYQEPPQEVPARTPLTMLPGRQRQVQAAAAPVQSATVPQTAQAPPVAAPPQALPASGFGAHKPEPEISQNETPVTGGGDELAMDDWSISNCDWSVQAESNTNDCSQAMNDEWGSSSNNQNDGYTVQGGNRNYSGRGRGPRGGRGSSNGYSGRGRGNFQNGRGGGGSGGYGYRNEDRSNNYYQNGYQRDNFSGGYKRGGRGGGGNPRGGSMERGGGNSRGGMDRGGVRTGGGRGGNNPRGNRSGNFPRGGGNKQQ